MPGRSLIRGLWGAMLLVLLPLAVLVALAADIWLFGQREDDTAADAAVILGAAAWNGRPSPVLRERIHHALSLYEAGQVDLLIFTGGQAPGEPLAESVAAARYALARGLAAEDAYCEVASADTWNNLRGAAAVVAEHDLGRVLVVSDPLHLRRAVAMARDLGLDAHPAPTPTSRFRGLEAKRNFLWAEVRLYGGYLLQRPFMDRSANPHAMGDCLSGE
ncbi:YdcF family protein [Alkalilimnicola ehrlichii MLHE-1]|nr:YdcF family protein [Alkalilimnicola ehrlichii]